MAQLNSTFIVAGKGGHETQARILSGLLFKVNIRTDTIFENSILLPSLSDISKERSNFNLKIIIPLSVAVFRNLHLLSCRGYIKARHPTFIFFGPLNNIPLMLVCKLFGYRCIFIESWSRFSCNSKTYRFARFLGFELYVQNESLFNEKENTYVGRLG